MSAQGEVSASSKTLLIRNLPYTTKDSDLEAVFGEYGPITEIMLYCKR